MPSSAAAVAVSGGGANAADELEDRPLEEGGELEGDEPAAAAAPCRAGVGKRARWLHNCHDGRCIVLYETSQDKPLKLSSRTAAAHPRSKAPAFPLLFW